VKLLNVGDGGLSSNLFSGWHWMQSTDSSQHKPASLFWPLIFHWASKGPCALWNEVKNYVPVFLLFYSALGGSESYGLEVLLKETQVVCVSISKWHTVLSARVNDTCSLIRFSQCVLSGWGELNVQGHLKTGHLMPRGSLWCILSWFYLLRWETIRAGIMFGFL